MSSSPVKVIKKGEFLFKEGDKIQNIQLIQSGGISLCLQRQKKNIDLAQLGASQVLGENSLSGATTHTVSAIATTETKIMEIPVETYKQSVEQAPQMLKVLIKSLGDRLKVAMGEVRNAKLEKDSSPCPEDQVAKVFGSLFHTANHKGTKDAKDPGKVSIEWSLMKQYAQRVFSESPKRLEQALTVLVKLKTVTFEMGRPPEDPEGPEQLMKVHFSDLASVEAFFEFYQYYYFKGGKTDLLKADDFATQLLNNLITCGEGLELDRHGVVTLDFQKTVERFKTDFGLQLNNDHFARLEQKGVFVKRKAMTNGPVVLQYEMKEFKTTQKVWKILREIEKWNEKGFVDLTEETVVKKKTDGPCCPECSAEMTAQAKFCSQCGFKMAA